MLIPSENIESIIPQRAPFVMIDELIDCSGSTTRTSFRVQSSNIFFDGKQLNESALVENMAQTAAAGVGYEAKQNNTPVPVGFIGAVQQLRVYTLPQENDWIETEVTVTNKVFDVTFIKGFVSCNNNVLAECEMKIFLQKQ